MNTKKDIKDILRNICARIVARMARVAAVHSSKGILLLLIHCLLLL